MAKIKVKEQPPKEKIFTNKKEFDKANKSYQDSLSLSKLFPRWGNYAELSNSLLKLNKVAPQIVNTPEGQRGVKKPTTKPIYKEPIKEEPKTIEQKVEQLNKETKFADVVLEKPQAESGEPFYHNNGDLIGFMQKGGKFEKLKDTQGLKPTTKEFLSDDKSVDSYMKFRLGEYYRGQAENK